MMYHVSNRFLKKKNRIYLWGSGILYLLWVLAPSWQHFVSRSLCQLSPIELCNWLIDLNQDSKVIQGLNKIMKSLKTMEILMFFVNFYLIQIQNCSGQIKKMKDEIFSFQLEKKYFCQMFTENARLKNVPFPLDLTRILKSYHKRNDRRKFPEK